MNKYQISRNFFQDRIRKGMIGPGSDIFMLKEDENHEIISDYPLIRYFSGILFPQQTSHCSQSKADEDELESETYKNDDEESVDGREGKLADDENGNNFQKKKVSRDVSSDNSQLSTNNFFPTNMGVTFCVVEGTKNVDVEFNFGVYFPETKDRRIKISKEEFDFFRNNSNFPFKDIITYEDGYMVLTRGLKGRSSFPRTEEFEQIDRFKNTEEFKKSDLSKIFYKFELLTRRMWRRRPVKIKTNVELKDGSYNRLFSDSMSGGHYLSVEYRIKTYKNEEKNPGRKYVKIQLINSSNPHPSNRFSNKNNYLNQKCIFQSSIKVFSDYFMPHRSYQELNPFDEEEQKLNRLYKDVKSYGVGHNCSFIWDMGNENESPQWVSSTFLPEYDVKGTLNSFEKKDLPINDLFDIYDLTIFSKLDRGQIIERLNKFILAYEEWCESEKESAGVIHKYEKIDEDIINQIQYNLDRLFDNVRLLSQPDVFEAFQLANTAMLIQIILSNDSAFGGNEKELNETIGELNNVNYNDLSFFQKYDLNRLSFKRPAYRPFQLAFLLLNIDSIINENSASRNEVVDMLWFPTGGGKTEAYLAVAAFTIIWRRKKFPDRSYGTSVIMRYTLRLLTAQQFERASRLIVALEFLRKNGVGKLGDEKICIGLWVGMSSTPNKIKGAFKIIEEIHNESNRNRNPENKNSFQISACPWCGTKLIAKNEIGWLTGFKMYSKNRRFKIRCNNEHCHFHEELPVQVVDEELYLTPPTLLFATVDKFAMLAWEGDGHKFFNSQNSNLPPDLIIQDELHLLSGPLGSITGLYESVIEWCCTDGNRIPKIIASTATTRNTDEQIRQLYGGRKVNVFPPSGLTYKDSFFAKIATTSKRRYIGFMPTGKTAIDTQLQLLAHLLFARLEVFFNANGDNILKADFEVIDRYWTIVSYYNSLKDVGRTFNKVGDEIMNFTSALQSRMTGEKREFNFNFFHLPVGAEELTSRISSPDIKKALKRLEEWKFEKDSLTKHEKGYWMLKEIIDLVLATNMISVGIDIERLNVMLVNGQPRNVAEYIQASSRVGRKNPGLVVCLLDANRARDKSHFEHFVPFHQAFYKSVEPLSVTPFTESTLDKMLTTLAVAYVRVIEPGMAAQNAVRYFEKGRLDGFRKRIYERFNNAGYLLELMDKKLEDIEKSWLDAVSDEVENYKKKGEVAGLLKKPSQVEKESEDLWLTMQSMREIDTTTFFHIDLPNKKS